MLFITKTRRSCKICFINSVFSTQFVSKIAVTVAEINSRFRIKPLLAPAQGAMWANQNLNILIFL